MSSPLRTSSRPHFSKPIIFQSPIIAMRPVASMHETVFAENFVVDSIAVHTVGVGLTPHPDRQPFFDDYGRFRGWVYTDVAGILTPDVLDDHAIEGDRFDRFSVHLAAIGLGHDQHGTAGEMVLGSTRLIVDIGNPDHPYVQAGLGVELGQLPVDEDFPEVAEEIDLRTRRVRCEVSRYAAHGLDRRSQLAVTAALRKATVAHYVNLGGDEAFAVLEKPLARNLRRNGVNLYRISDSRRLDRYDSVNFAVVIDLYGLARNLGCDHVGLDPFDVVVEVPHARA